MTTETGETMVVVHVLIVDDNRNYRQAFRRNLELEGYEVVEAEDCDEAMLRMQESKLDVIVTDLAMRHPTEGLDLIRQARSINPHLPIIMISAVGTFEEGAAASRLGARYVISKSKIDEEMENLFKAIEQANEEYRRSLKYVERIEQLRSVAEKDAGEASAGLRAIVTGRDVPETVKGEAFDVLLSLETPDLQETSQQDVDRVRAEASSTRDLYETADSALREHLEQFDTLDQDTRQSLGTAEFLYVHSDSIEESVDFSRSIGFSYCFAVENEAKVRLRKRLQRFFGDAGTAGLIRSLLEDNKRSLSLFYHQHLLRVLREVEMDVTVDNIYQTFQRILEHGAKYKPDGLKALGIVMLCFGRDYSFRKFQKEIRVDNPLALKGLEDEAEVLRLACLLTNLQHYRNPYIHPEISEMEKLSKIRETTFECINILFKLV